LADQGMSSSGLAGDPTMGMVQGAVSPNYPVNTMQMITLDSSGAQKSSNEGMKATYSASTSVFAPANNATDILGIIGSATKKTRVLRMALSGRATAAANIDVTVQKRSTPNTGGAPVAVAAVPHDSNDPAATASCVTYGANPAPLGTIAGQIRAVQSNVSQAGSGGAASPFEHDFGWVNDKAVVLNNPNEGLYFNLGGVAVPAGTVLNMFVEWTEE
jgi:hypothetical protein